MNTTRAMTLAVVVLVIGVQQGFAAPSPNLGDFQTQRSGNWADSGTWQEWTGSAWVDTANVPGSKSLATILGTHTVTITSLTAARIRTLILKEDASTPATLEISAAASLTIHHALEMENDNNGVATTINLAATSSAGASLIAQSDITIAGTIDVTGDGVGTISSDAAGDVVTVSASGLLTAGVGDLTVTSADVVMDGTVRPASNRTITFSGGINSGSSGNWELTNPGSIIRIHTTNPVDIVSSAGHIWITDGGTLDIDTSFSFAGGLKQTGGTIDVASLVLFTVSGRYFN